MARRSPSILLSAMLAFLSWGVNVASAQSCGGGSASLFFIGDMMQHDAQIKAAYDSASNTYDYSAYFTHIKPIVQSSDISICNLEVTLGGMPYKGYPQFSAPDEYLDEIINTGFDVILTANNHCLDKGRIGLERTIQQVAKTGLPQLGTYVDSADRENRYPLLVEKNGLRIVMLNYTYGTNGLKPKAGNVVNYIIKEQILKDIDAAKKMMPDFIIANVHWGIEYVFEENDEQRQLGRWLIDAGVDHVIGGHPHVVQPIDVYQTDDGRRHLIVYSLGNVISNMSKRGTDGGIMLGFTLNADDYNVTADSAWFTTFHVARPVKSGLPNFTMFPLGTPSSLLPDGEERLLDDFAQLVRHIMLKGDEVRELKSCEWPISDKTEPMLKTAD